MSGREDVFRVLYDALDMAEAQGDERTAGHCQDLLAHAHELRRVAMGIRRRLRLRASGITVDTPNG